MIRYRPLTSSAEDYLTELERITTCTLILSSHQSAYYRIALSLTRASDQILVGSMQLLYPSASSLMKICSVQHVRYSVSVSVPVQQD